MQGGINLILRFLFILIHFCPSIVRSSMFYSNLRALSVVKDF